MNRDRLQASRKTKNSKYINIDPKNKVCSKFRMEMLKLSGLGFYMFKFSLADILLRDRGNVKVERIDIVK